MAAKDKAMMQLCRCLLAFSAIAASGVTVRVTIERPLVRFFGWVGSDPRERGNNAWAPRPAAATRLFGLRFLLDAHVVA